MHNKKMENVLELTGNAHNGKTHTLVHKGRMG